MFFQHSPFYKQIEEIQMKTESLTQNRTQ